MKSMYEFEVETESRLLWVIYWKEDIDDPPDYEIVNEEDAVIEVDEHTRMYIEDKIEEDYRQRLQGWADDYYNEQSELL